MHTKFADQKPNDDAKDRLIAEQRAEIERLRALQGKALTGMLTDAKIAKLKRRGRHRDCDNLYIQVPNEGSKKRSWLFGHTIKGKFKSFGLGSYPDVSIQKAREDAQLCRIAIQDGEDPETKYKMRKQSIVAASGLIMTVQQVAIEWWQDMITPNQSEYPKRVENQLKKHVYGTIGHLLIETIDQKTILDDATPDMPRVGLKRLWRYKHPTGKIMQQHLERIFDFAIFKGYYNKANPAAMGTLQYQLPKPINFYERKHRDALEIDEMYGFLQQLRAIEDRSVRKTGHPMLALLVEAAAYTGVRIGELIKAEQHEFNRTTLTWNVPWFHLKGGIRKKKRRPVRPVPITPSVLRVLDEAAARRKQIGLGDDPNALVFPSDKQGHIGKMVKPSSPSTFIRRNFPGLKLHPHGFRSTLRDWRRMRTQFKDELWKLQVDQNIGNATDEAYGHNLLLEERREMMMLYDTFLSKPPTPKAKAGKVIDLGDRRRRA